MLPFKKIYVDSRWCTNDSIGASNFKVELPVTMLCPENCVFFITDVCVPHTWETIEMGINDKLYVMTVLNGLFTNNILTLTPNNYTPATFVTELQTQLQNINGSFSVTLDINNGVVISNGAVLFKILTDDELVNKLYWTGADYDKNNLNTANELINNTVSSRNFVGTSSSYTSNFLNLNWINNVYMTSPNLGSFDTLFAGRGDNNIIKKVPVNVGYGYMIFDPSSSPNDFLDCSKQSLQTIEFHLKTARGDYIPLHGGHVSFSIVFNRFNQS